MEKIRNKNKNKNVTNVNNVIKNLFDAVSSASHDNTALKTYINTQLSSLSIKIDGEESNLIGLITPVSDSVFNYFLRKIQTYANDGTTAPTVQDYINAGITGVDANNLNAVNAVINASDTGGTNTLAEIKAIAVAGIADAGNTPADTALAKIQAYANDGTTAPTVQDYIDAGITGVDADNLALVNAGIDASDRAGTLTLDDIKAIAEPALLKLRELLQAIVISSDSTKPTVQDYIDAGIKGVDAGNLEAVTEIQVYAIGGSSAPSYFDYSNAGITGADSFNGNEVNAGILGSDIIVADALSKIQAIVSASAGLVKIKAYGVNSTFNTAPTAQNYIDAGITGVNDNNIGDINGLIAASEFKLAVTYTVEDIQEIVDARQ